MGPKAAARKHSFFELKAVLAIGCLVIGAACYVIFAPISNKTVGSEDVVERLPIKGSGTYVVFHGVGSGTKAHWYLTTADGKAFSEQDAVKIMNDMHLPVPPRYSDDH